jgi:dephospho-CoA kinase
VVGLVGPAGSGKSTVARALGEAGARVLDADRMGHDITDHVPEVRAALADEYGADVYRADGTLDRRRVAAKVFTDPAALTRLNLLVHPRILDRLRAAIAAATLERFGGALVVDAALMLDWGFERECDAVIAVVAPAPVQIARLVAARGWTEAEARQRLERARSNQAFADLADEVIVNDGSETDAAAAARAALDRLFARRAGAGA